MVEGKPAEGRVVLITVDDSDSSEHALEWALENIYREGDDARLLHVVPVTAPHSMPLVLDLVVPAFPIEADPQEDAEHVAAAKEFMSRRFGTKMASRSIPYKIEIVHFLTDLDSIGEAICKRAASQHAAVVVMCKHQRGAISEFFLGSVTKYCATNCQAPLVILH